VNQKKKNEERRETRGAERTGRDKKGHKRRGTGPKIILLIRGDIGTDKKNKTLPPGPLTRGGKVMEEGSMNQFRPGAAMLVGYLTLDAAAQYASVSPRTVKRWIARGLPVYQGTPRGKILVRPGDIDQYLEKRTAPRLDLDVMVHEVMRGLAKQAA
jgi:hypothetical protein